MDYPWRKPSSLGLVMIYGQTNEFSGKRFGLESAVSLISKLEDGKIALKRWFNLFCEEQ